MSEIVLARIDDRLIHGQVMTSWVQFSGGNHIVIVDDQTAEDEFLKPILKMAVPVGIGLDVFNTQQGIEFLTKLEGDKKIIILAKTPETFFNLIEGGVKLSEVIVGGMGAGPKRSKFYKNISASDDERETFKKIIDNGVKVIIQIIPAEKAVNADSILK